MLLTKPLLSREFVGREQEIEQLRHAWQHTSMRNPQLLLISDEPELHEQPIVFVLEDLHWADETSLELLSFLAHQLDSSSMQADPPVPLLLLGTYRSEGLPDNAALQRMMRHLQAQRYMTELHLTSLT